MNNWNISLMSNKPFYYTDWNFDLNRSAIMLFVIVVCLNWDRLGIRNWQMCVHSIVNQVKYKNIYLKLELCCVAFFSCFSCLIRFLWLIQKKKQNPSNESRQSQVLNIDSILYLVCVLIQPKWQGYTLIVKAFSFTLRSHSGDDKKSFMFS